MAERITVAWHENAIRTAVERLHACLNTEDSAANDVHEINGKRVTSMDLWCLLDAGRAVLAEEPAPSSSDAPNRTATLMAALIEQELELAHSGEGYEPKAVAEEIVKDHVTPVLAERDRLNREARRHMHLAERREREREVERDIALWLHAEAVWQRDEAWHELDGLEQARDEILKLATTWEQLAEPNMGARGRGEAMKECARQLRLLVEQPDTEAAGQAPVLFCAEHVQVGKTIRVCGERVPDGFCPEHGDVGPPRAEQPVTPATPTGVAVVELDADDPLAQRVEHDSRMDGVDTPGCDCGHSGMGEGWHSSDCTWKQTPAAPTLRACSQDEGCTGISCDLPARHPDSHEGKATYEQAKYVGYQLTVIWPRMPYDKCKPPLTEVGDQAPGGES